ncbi:MAG: pyruvate dehydrogenase (acetyl-transferring) E1 component subunit alpha, partial [Myxococcales bacterium]|nr:pyruvate dehydrogenase (acetyl-transferring) E1 component subunit alpha [Myxococcales bacterium]
MLELPRDPRRRRHARLVYARQLDRKLLSLSRQGRARVYTPFLGQEAAQLGCVAAMQRDDLLVPTFRDTAAMLFHGVPLDDLILFWMGYEEAHLGFGHTLPLAAPIATHLPHAVGLAHAATLDGSRRAAVVMFGDGATSKGDFHEALNLAAVLRAPVVFFCQNNQWAISTPLAAQTAQHDIAAKAAAYALPGERVDGNDADAVERAVLVALERARRGDGPTLIEALTWRRDGHSAIDDPSRYRDPRSDRPWIARDPLDRMRRRLEHEGRSDPAAALDFADRAALHIDAAVARAEAR